MKDNIGIYSSIKIFGLYAHLTVPCQILVFEIIIRHTIDMFYNLNFSVLEKMYVLFKDML